MSHVRSVILIIVLLFSLVASQSAETAISTSISTSEVFRDLGSLCGRKLGQISEVTEDLGDRNGG